MAIWDAFNAQPGSAEALQLQGLLGGLTRMGGLLAQAGQFRPAGTPGPGIGDAFLGFGEGQRAGVQNAAQQAQMQQKMARQALIAEAQSAKPDADLSPQAAAMRRALSGMPEDVRALAGPDELPGLAIDRAKSRMTPIDAARAAALGLRPGTVAMESAWTGAPSVLQQSDVMSPEAYAQKLRLTAAGRGPTVSWRDEHDAAGNLVGQRSSTGQFQPIAAKPMSPAQAMMTLAQLGTAVASGAVKPGTPEFEKYTVAYMAASEKVDWVFNPNNPGTLMPVQTRRAIPDRYPNPEAVIAASGGQASPVAPPAVATPEPSGGGAAPVAPPAAAPPAQAPQAPQAAPAGVLVPGSGGMTASPPLAPLPRDQSGAIRATPAAIEQVRKGELETARVADAIQNFRDVLKTNPTGLSTFLNNPNDPKAQQVLMAYERVKMTMRGETLMNTGVLQPGENVMLENMLLSPNTLRGAIAKPAAYEARLREVEKMITDGYNASRKQVGLPPITSLSSVGAGAASRSGGAVPPPPPGFVR